MNKATWYKKKRFIIPVFILGLLFLGLCDASTSPPSEQSPQSASQTANVVGPNSTSVRDTASPSSKAPSLYILYAANNDDVTAKPNTLVVPPSLPTIQTAPSEPASTSGNNLSNDNHYTNSSGNVVHSPAYSNDGSVPAGATAQCRDGTYSFSQHRRGTCSHHGGVARWF